MLCMSQKLVTIYGYFFHIFNTFENPRKNTKSNFLKFIQGKVGVKKSEKIRKNYLVKEVFWINVRKVVKKPYNVFNIYLFLFWGAIGATNIPENQKLLCACSGLRDLWAPC